MTKRYSLPKKGTLSIHDFRSTSAIRIGIIQCAMDVALTPLELSPEKLVHEVIRFSPYLTLFQIDVADNIFVPNCTAHPKEYLDNLPADPHLAYDFHLMVINPAPYLEQLAQAKKTLPIGTVFIHSAIHPNVPRLRTLYPSLTFGLVVNEEEDVQTVSQEYSLNDFPVVQVMSVKTGFQGTPFLPQSLNKIEQLRKIHYRNKISLDGGVNESSIKDICKAPFKPDLVAVGHYLIGAPDSEITRRIRLLRSSC